MIGDISGRRLGGGGEGNCLEKTVRRKGKIKYEKEEIFKEALEENFPELQVSSFQIERAH